MRIVGFESSSRRGSIALVEHDCLIASLSHEEPQRHAEHLLPLLERLLAEAGWPKSSIDRLGVGVGPGSFTGLRAGIALAEGLSLGLDRPLVGVGSLRAMAYGALREQAGPCCALLDARRAELFAGLYSASGQELMAPAVLPSPEVPGFLSKNAVRTLVGEAAAPFSEGRVWAYGATLDLPHARWVAALAAELNVGDFPPEPEYVRGIGATLPSLPRSPIDPQ